MKKSYLIKVMCFVCLLIGNITIQAQEDSKQTASQIQNLITVWDGSTWSKGEPNLATKAVFAKDFVTTENLYALEMEVLADVTVRFKENAVLKVVNDILVPSSSRLAFEDNTQLLQKNSATPPVVDIIRKTTPVSKRDYTYFCSPVAGQQLNLITDYSVPGGVNNFYPNENGYLNGQPAVGVYNPPLFDKYFTWNASGTPVGTDALLLNTGFWQNISQTTLMDPAGKGYIVRGPNSFPEVTPKYQWQVKFTGIPNTAAVINTFTTGITYTPFSGAVTPYVPVTAPDPFVPYEPCNNGLFGWNLIGNPYPSMIDADTFLTNPANITNLGGALYFWTHGSDVSAENGGNGTAPLNYTTDDYVTYNLTGGIGGAKRPNGKVATCQGFFTFGLTANSSATFTTDMRDESLSGNTLINNQQFFRTNNQSMITPLTKNRIWVSLSSGTTIFKETLIGYIPSATTTNGTIAGSISGYDKMYDTELLKTIYNTETELNNRIELYTILNPTTACPRLAIQGRTLATSFNTDDVVALGFSCPAGTYTIKAATFDGLFGSQMFWLKENDGTNITYRDIRTTSYTFTTTATTSDNTTRFQIVFKSNQNTTQVNANFCGTTITDLNNLIFCGQIAGASGYIFEVTEVGNTSNVRTITRSPNNSFSFQMLAGVTTLGTQYSIRVSPIIGGISQGFGTACIITTNALPPTTYINTGCGTSSSKVVSFFITQVNSIGGLAPTKYRVRVVNETTGVISFLDLNWPMYSFQFQNTGFAPAITVTPSTTYTISVAIEWNGVWQNYGVACTHTKASVITRQLEDGIFIFEASTYPNPFADNFKLDINTSSEDEIQILVYDMLGRQMETRTIQVADLDTQEIGTNYASGVYNLIIKQADNIKTLRVIKR